MSTINYITFKINIMKKMKLLIYLCVFLFCQNASAQATISNTNLSYYNLSCDQIAVPLTADLCGFNTGDIITGILDFGDGTSTVINSYTVNAALNGCDTNYYTVTNHNYLNPGTYTLTATLTGLNASSTITLIINSSNCYYFSGYVFNDLNSNCLQDPGEVPCIGIPVESYLANQLQQTTYTDLNGYYMLNYPAYAPNGYTIKIGTVNGSTITCPVAQAYAPTGIAASNLNFGMNITPSMSILNLSPYTNSTNCTDTYEFTSTIELCNITSGNLQIDIDYGDGGTNTTNTAYAPSAGISCSNMSFNLPLHTYAVAGNYTITITASINGFSNTMTASLTVFSCSQYNGYLFFDANGNCIKDAGELPYTYAGVMLISNGMSYYENSDANGYYNFSIPNPNGNQVDISPNNNVALSCSTQSTYTTNATSGSNIDFGFLQPNPSLNAYLSNNINGCGTTQFDGNLTVTQCSSSGALTALVDFGDGTLPVTYNGFLSGGLQNGCENFYLPMALSHSYSSYGTYTITTTVSDGSLSTFTNSIISLGPCSNFNGSIFVDGNNNCINDLGEALPFQSVNIEELNGTYVASATTDINGNYQAQFQFTNGMTYKVYPSTLSQTGGCYNVTCPSSLFYLVNTPLSSNLDFGITNTNANFDNTISGINPWCCGNLQAGTNRTIRVNYMNLLCADNNGDITLTLEPNMSFNWANPVPSSVTGNVITWSYSNLNNMTWNHFVEANIYIPFLNNAGQAYVTGDTICLTASINANAGTDIDMTNNTANQCLYIGTAYDPNDKHGMPQGNGPNGLIAKGTNIEYMIRFQNTGTAPAQQIYILDTLDNDIDENTIKILGNSHNVVLTKNGNVLRFDFPNIMLPDSGSNIDESQGFVRFLAKQKTTIPYGAVINNTAYIHFDAQAAVVTNTTIHTIKGPTGIMELSANDNIDIYPNPTQNIIHIKHNSGGKIAKVELLNTLGAVVMVEEKADTEIKLSVKHLGNAIYWLCITDQNGNRIMKSFSKE
jgi:hypothetical protein